MAVDWTTIDYQRTAERKAKHARQWLFRVIDNPADFMGVFYRQDAIKYQRDAAVYSRIARRRMEVEE